LLTTRPTANGLDELRRGWKIILLAGVGLACGLGAIPIYSLGVLTKPLSETFGWSRAEVQGIYTWFTIGNLLAAPAVGWLIDHHGVRRVTLVSIIGMAIGMASLGIFTGPLWSFYLIAFITAIIGVGTVPITWTWLIVDWFDISRGRALGIALAGTGVSATLLPSYATWLLTDYGWRVTYVGLAALPALLAFPLSYLLLFERSSRPTATVRVEKHVKKVSDERVGLEFRDAIADYRFWILNASFIMIALAIAGLISHLIPMLTDRAVSLETAAKVAGVIGIAVIIGRIGTGYLIDRFWAPAVGLLLLSLPALSCVLLATGYGGVYAAMFAAVLIGLAAGAEFDLMSFLVSKYFGQRRYGILYSCLYAVFKLSAGIAAPLFGLSFDQTGSYSFILFCAAGSLLGGSCLLLALGRYRFSS